MEIVIAWVVADSCFLGASKMRKVGVSKHMGNWNLKQMFRQSPGKISERLGSEEWRLWYLCKFFKGIICTDFKRWGLDKAK